MVTCQSVNQLKTPAKVSWAFKMVSQFGSLGYTIMGKTADLTVVQKTIIDTLHKEDKPQTFIAKEAVHRVLYPSMLTESWVEGKSVEEKGKRCTTNRENHSLMRIVKQNRFKNLGELHKEWTETGVNASRATTHRRVNEFGYSYYIPLVKPLLNHRQCQRRLIWAKEKKNWTVTQWSKVLFSDESKFCISFVNQGPRVWRKGGEAHSPSCLKSKRKMRNKRPKNADELKATIKETWASIPFQQCHKLITSIPRQIEAVIKAKGAPTKYWVHIQ